MLHTLARLVVVAGLAVGASGTRVWAQGADAKPAVGAKNAQDGELSPEEKARFDRAADYSAGISGRAMLVMRGGKVIYERYDNGWAPEKPHPLASGTKSFTGVAAMFAVQDGLLTLDEKACDTLTEWKSDPAKSAITVRQLLNLSSGLLPDSDSGKKKGGRLLGDGGAKGAAPKAGEAANWGKEDWFATAIAAPMKGTAGGQFAYGGNHFYAFGALLERKLEKSELEQDELWDYYTARIFDPIGMSVAWIGRDKKNNPNLPGGALLTAREWAKFGQFVLQKGAWKQPDGTMKQLLKPELLAQCFEPSAKNPSYGLTWWLLRSDDGSSRVADGAGLEGAEAPAKKQAEGGRPGGTVRERIQERLRERMQDASFKEQSKPILGPDGKPIEVMMAAGLGKQRLYVIPQYDMVIVRFAEYTREGSAFDNRKFLAPILNVEAQVEKPQVEKTKE